MTSILFLAANVQRYFYSGEHSFLLLVTFVTLAKLFSLDPPPLQEKGDQDML